jgi:hypothetical protein
VGVLRKRRDGASAVAWCAALVAAAAPCGADAGASITDVAVGDPDALYVNIEFSPNYEHAIVLEGIDGGGGIEYRAWLSGVDPFDGTLVPPDGRGEFLGPSHVLGTPQWGVDAGGIYAVMLDPERYFVTIRPRAGNPPDVVTLDGDPAPAEERSLRAYPFPARYSPTTRQYVLYQRRDEAGNEVSLWLADLTDLSSFEFVFSEPFEVAGRQPALLSGFQRWLRPSLVFTHGRYAPDCVNPNCPIEVQRGRVGPGGGVQTEPATVDGLHKIDPFPFYSLLGGAGLLAGVNNEPNGQVYSFDTGSLLFVPGEQVAIDRAQSHLDLAGLAQSFEPFEWRGQQYATYQILERALGGGAGFASNVPGEIWVVKLGPPVVNCRVSVLDHPFDPLNPNKRTRLDPEPVVYNGRASIYYHAGPQAESQVPEELHIRRIDLGPKASFDQACEEGLAFPLP